MESDDGEKVALTWFLHNACTSNVELAIISSVCSRWREVASLVVASEAVALASAGGDVEEIATTSSSGCSVEGDGRDGDVASSSAGGPSLSRRCIRTLLITDMARELVARQRWHQRRHERRDTTTGTSEEEEEGGAQRSDRIHPPNYNTEGNFCLAWFAPSGMQTVSVSISKDDGEDDDLPATKTTASTTHQRRNGRGGEISKKGRNVNCCPEWRGYRHATEVLIPFGYSKEFIMNVFDASSKLHLAQSSAVRNTELESPSSLSSSHQHKTPKISSHEFDPTYAVRGATLARPDGFCRCVDGDYIEHANSKSSQKPSHAARHCVPYSVDGRMNDCDDNNPSSRGLAPIQRTRKQKSLEKTLLPRMILSTRRKCPLLHRFFEADADENETEQRTLPWERRQRAIQFLNSDRSQAIKLITPPFECGPIHGPITVFIIGITTEDGCFLSGRSSRFEFGHMYPLCARDIQIDMSPIAIATGKRDKNEMRNCTKHDARSPTATPSTFSGDDNDSTESERLRCLCKFDSGDPFNPKDLSVDDPTEDCIHRGTTGPGLWHCYTAVFDGKDSLIRVDGCNEPKRTREHYGFASSDEEDGDADSSANSSRFVGSGALDGLTIGSDHQFDMSLCYGEIEGQCGEGAIAELAVFKGRMDDIDIIKLEKNLMKKHGILSVEEMKEFVAGENSTRMKPLNIDCPMKEDEWRRQAHALIEHRWPADSEESMPLRVAANHHSVAWRRTNEITGSPIMIQRIGTKHGNGSSDW